jgi:hypothetical protein
VSRGAIPAPLVRVTGPVRAQGQAGPNKSGYSFRTREEGPNHGVVGLVHATDQDKGLFPILGEKVTCFPRPFFPSPSDKSGVTGLCSPSSIKI